MDPSRHTYTSPRPSLSVNLDDMGAEGAAGALMNTVQAAAYLNLAPSTLEKDRVFGRLRIPYIKLGSKRVAYERRDLDQWKQARKRCSTSERAA